MKEETAVKGRVLSATVSREADRWFVSFTVERDRAVAEPRIEGRDVGIDLGIHSFAVVSDGTELQSPRPLKRGLKRLRRLQKRHSRKQKGSSNRRKSAVRLGRQDRAVVRPPLTNLSDLEIQKIGEALKLSRISKQGAEGLDLSAQGHLAA